MERKRRWLFINLYFAGGLNFCRVIPLKELGVKHVLSSWLEKKDAFYPDFDVFLDSGAFTAETLGKKIDIDEYIAHIKKNEHNLGVYANLDVIYNAEGTLKNYEYMKSKDLNPLPVYHQFEDVKYLRHYLENEDYIALGGMVGSGENYLRPFLDNCFSVIKEYWPKKVHGFGINALWALKRYPFYSVDSTSWLSGGRFGQVFKGDTIAHRSLKKVNNGKMYSRALNYKEMAVKNTQAFLELEKNITYLWERRGITWK